MNQPDKAGSGQAATLSRSFEIDILRHRVAYEQRTVALDERRHADAKAATAAAWTASWKATERGQELSDAWRAAQTKEAVICESLAASRGRELAASRELLALVLS